MDGLESRQIKDDYSSIRATRNECRGRRRGGRSGEEGKLTDEGRVALKQGEEFSAEPRVEVSPEHSLGDIERHSSSVPGLRAPDPDGRIETASHNTNAVESDGVDLVDMTSEDVKALPSIDIPQLGAMKW